MSTTLSWNDRLRLIDHYKPADAVACSAFGVSADELDTAREMAKSGTFTPTKDLDVKSYASLFANANIESPAPTGEGESTVRVTEASTSTSKTKTRKASATSTKRATGKPETATKPVKEPKKRGRKGTNIESAYSKIPVKPTDVDAFAQKYGVSVNVLRQSKRFDRCPEKGPVRVKKDKESGKLMIWREKPVSV